MYQKKNTRETAPVFCPIISDECRRDCRFKVNGQFLQECLLKMVLHIIIKNDALAENNAGGTT